GTRAGPDRGADRLPGRWRRPADRARLEAEARPALRARGDARGDAAQAPPIARPCARPWHLRSNLARGLRAHPRNGAGPLSAASALAIDAGRIAAGRIADQAPVAGSHQSLWLSESRSLRRGALAVLRRGALDLRTRLGRPVTHCRKCIDVNPGSWFRLNRACGTRRHR